DVAYPGAPTPVAGRIRRDRDHSDVSGLHGGIQRGLAWIRFRGGGTGTSQQERGAYSGYGQSTHDFPPKCAVPYDGSAVRPGTAGVSVVEDQAERLGERRGQVQQLDLGDPHAREGI